MAINGNIIQLAQNASTATGEDVNVVLAHWQTEQGITSTSDWFHNNPAGITHGNSQVDAISNGTVDVKGSDGVTRKFDTFSTDFYGAEAYTILVNTDPAYSDIRKAIATKDGEKEIQAIGSSPWGTNAKDLQTNYDNLKNSNQSGNNQQHYNGQPSEVPAQPFSSLFSGLNLNSFLGINLTPTELLIVVAGTILIVLLIWKAVGSPVPIPV